MSQNNPKPPALTDAKIHELVRRYRELSVLEETHRAAAREADLLLRKTSGELKDIQDQHPPHPHDKEKVCPMEKRVRSRIGSKYPDLLPLLGLTQKEHAGAQRWASIPPAERERIAEVGRTALKRLNRQTPTKSANLHAGPETRTRDPESAES